GDDHVAGPLRRVHRLDAQAARRPAADPRAAPRSSGRTFWKRFCEARMRLKAALQIGAFLALAALVAVCPHLVSDYRAGEFAIVGMYLIALLGLAVLTGYSGQISLGHGAFMAIGGYTTAILSVDGIYGHQIRDLWTIPIAGVIAGLAGLLVGVPALRLSGLYLA